MFFGRDGVLETDFGTSGIVVLPTPHSFLGDGAIVNDKLVMAGHLNYPFNFDLAMMRADIGLGKIFHYGSGLAGTGGLVPQISASGTLCVGDSIRLSFSDTQPTASGVLIAGASALNAAFRGAVMYPHPDLILPISMPTFASVTSTMDSQMVGLDVHVQAFWFDPGAVEGLSATPAVHYQMY
jgi:hypothetical protein